MARSLAVTTASTKVVLQETPAQGGQPARYTGQASFTITNTATVPIKAQASVVPQGTTPKDVFTISGSSNWDIPPNGTAQLSVGIVLQASESTTICQFLALVANAADPDEDFAESPVVTCQAPGQKVPGKPPFVLIGIIAAVVILGALVTFKLLSGGKKTPEATPTPSSTVPTFHVTFFPVPGATKQPGGIFTLPPSGIVPNVLGVSSDQAQQILQAAGYEVSVTDGTSFAPQGTIVNEDPAGGESALKGSTITLAKATPPIKVVDDKQLTLNGEANIDLDSGTITIAGSDVIFDCCYSFTTVGDALIAHVDTADPAECWNSTSKGHFKLHVDASHTHLCFITSEGEVSVLTGKFLIFGLPPLLATVSTWEKPQY